MIVFLVLISIFEIAKTQGQNQDGTTRPFPSEQRLASWAEKFDSELLRLTVGEEDITKASQLAEVYQKAFDDGVGYSIEKPNGEKIATKMMKKIKNVFEMNIKALEDLHDSAASAVNDYTYKDNLKLEDINYTNVNRMEHLQNNLNYSEHFKQEIYTQTSGVQIPIEIYEGYPNILNSIAWTKNLDETFKANSEKYPGIYWQTFGSQEGILRVYPASKWQTVDDMPDLFDVRRRPWYIHGTSSPKDMIILLDTSGSMHGQSFDIMKIAAKTLLNTLGENDFVNVASFAANQTSWVTPCLQGLVQANTRNKRLLFDGIDLLVDGNIAYYEKALKFAYTHLEDFEQEKDENDGSECHKLIMVFSDGGTENPTKILNVYTNSSREITSDARIFTYAVGPHPLPTVALKEMACRTGGAFTTITAMGAIRTKIQNSYMPIITTNAEMILGFSSIYLNAVEYVEILNRPLVLAKYYDFYKSTFFTRDHLGLGFVTTITKPVFNTSSNSDNQTLAGVVGIDIPVSRFEGFAPKTELGPLGYVFGLNTNGFLIFHPKLSSLSNYLDDPAHNDIEDVEGENIAELRKNMIDAAIDNKNEQMEIAVGKKKIKSTTVLNQGHAISVDMEYYYTAIQKTHFSLAVVVPKFWHYIKVPEQLQAKKMLEEMKKDSTMYLAKRKFCDESIENEDADHDTPEGMLEKLMTETCHGKDFNHLIWDYQVVSNNWNKNQEQFVLTDGGLIMTAQDENLKQDPYNSSLYKMAVLSPTPIIYVQKYVDRRVIPIYIHSSSSSSDDNQNEDDHEDHVDSSDHVHDDESSPHHSTEAPVKKPNFVIQVKQPTLYLAQKIRISDGKQSENKTYTTVGVSGIELSKDFLRKILFKASEAPANSNELDCKNFKYNLLCYLVDTSGYILASNQDERVPVGDFFGVADPQLMKHLLKKNFFHSKKEFNYQALCPTDINCTTDGAADLPKLFLVTIFHSLVNLLQTLNHSIFTVVALVFGTQFGLTESASEYTKQVTEGLHRCTTETEHWEWNMSAPVVFHDEIDAQCQGITCKREFYSYKLSNLNALMIIAEPQYCSSCNPKPKFDGPLEVPSGEDCMLPSRYRRRPQDCFAVHEAEICECCSIASDLKFSTILRILSVVVPMYFSLPRLII